MSTSSLGVLVLGAGWVSAQHVAAYQANPHTRVLAICDRTLETARQRASAAGLTDVTCYDDVQRAIAHPGVDIVSICTPQHLHCQHAVAAAGAGKHILLEKPAGISLEQIDTIRQAVRAAGVRTVVGFVLRWNPLFIDAQGDACRRRDRAALLCRSRLPEPQRELVAGLERRPYPGPRRQRLPGRRLPCDRRPAVVCRSRRVRSGHARGSLCRGRRIPQGQDREYNPVSNTWIDGAPPMEYDGLEVALVKFDNGAVGKVSVNADCIMPYRFPLRIFGNLGTVMDNRVWSHKYPGQTDWVELPTILPDSSNVAHHPFQAEIDHLVECVRSGRESHCNLDDAVKTHEIAFAALRSQQTGQPVRLPLT